MAKRTCIGCKRVCEKKDLVRLVLEGNKVFVDLSSKHDGRGAYVHAGIACISKALNEKLLMHKLRFNQVIKAANTEEQFKLSSLSNDTKKIGIDLSELKKFAGELIASAEQ